MSLQKGGYRLSREIRRDFRGDLFTEYILPMIFHQGTVFQILNTGSMYGFVVIMTVDMSISKFVNDEDEPVNEFVIKICELHGPNTICGRALKKTGELFKRSISYETFLRECKTQQKIWDERLGLGLKQICPAFTYSKIIEYHNRSNQTLIKELVEKMFQSDGNIIEYLLREISIHLYDLGFMMMEKIEGVTLKDARQVDPGLYDSTARFICAASITLFLSHAVVNTDMNQGNCILNQSTGDITMIDFGLVMTPEYLIQCINSRGDTLRTTRSSSPENTFLIRQLKENLLEFQKLQFFLTRLTGFSIASPSCTPISPCLLKRKS
jgi:serine/threonine protein kinase